MQAGAVVLGLVAVGAAVAVAVGADVVPASVSVRHLADSPTADLLLAVSGNGAAAASASASAAAAVADDGATDWAWAVGVVAVFYGGLALLGFVGARAFRTERTRRWATAVVAAAGAAFLLWLLARVLLLRADGSADLLGVVAGSLAWAQLLLTALAALVVLAGLASLALRPGIRSVLAEVDIPRGEDSPAPPMATAGGPTRRLGLAFSGGGIRAASMTLGALQTLEDQADLGWSAASRVTAVSGGSYMAGGWSVARAQQPDPEQPANVPAPWAALGDQPGPEEQHLMANLGYLLANRPRGAGGADEGDQQAADAQRRAARFPAVFATVITGMALNATVLLALLWVVTQPVGWLYRWYFGRLCDWPAGDLDYASQGACVSESPTWWPCLVWAALGLAAILVWVVAAKRFELRGDGVPPAWVLALKYAGYGGVALGLALALVLGLVPALLALVWRPDLISANVAAAVGVLGSASAVVRMVRKPLARFAPLIGGALFALLLVFLGCRWVLFGMDHGTRWWWCWAVVVGLLVLVQACTSPEWWSLAAFYRSKLRLAFATYRLPGGLVAHAYANGSFRGTDSYRVPEPSLADLTTRDVDPVHGTPLTVCTTATVSGRQVRTHHGVPAMSVTFDPEHVTLHVPTGEPGVFRRHRASTATLATLMPRRSPRVTTMMSVGLSGAAVSPAMGRFRVGPVSMLLTFANVRLGMWIPNPRYADTLAAAGVRLPRPGLGYLLKEFFGFHDPSDLFLYVTDGGHWENTGLVELLRTSDCREVVCIDADAGPGNLASSISKAIDLAWLECRCRVVMDLDVLRSEVTVSPGRDYSQRSVNLGLVERTIMGTTTVSLLWYAKPALTRDMPLHLLSYREVDPTFPRVSTLNQFFHLAQYTAYRDLGRFNARQLVDAREVLVAGLAAAPTLADFRDLSQRQEAPWVLAELERLIDDLVRDEPAAGRPAHAAQVYDQVREVLIGADAAPPRTLPA